MTDRAVCCVRRHLRIPAPREVVFRTGKESRGILNSLLIKFMVKTIRWGKNIKYKNSLEGIGKGKEGFWEIISLFPFPLISSSDKWEGGNNGELYTPLKERRLEILHS